MAILVALKITMHNQIKKFLLFGIATSVLWGGCTRQAPAPSPDWSSRKIYEEVLVEGDHSYTVSLFDEVKGIERRIRLEASRDGAKLHKVEESPFSNSGFLISMPLESGNHSFERFQALKEEFELQLNEGFYRMLTRYVEEGRFSIKAHVDWDATKLKEVRLRRLGVVHNLAEGNGASTSFPDAIEAIRVDVILDRSLPGHYDTFVREAIETQSKLQLSRGDTVSIQRELIPRKQSGSIAPFEEERLTELIKKFIKKYIHLDDFLVSVQLHHREEGVGLRKHVVITLNDTVSPEADQFLRETVPAQIRLAESEGDLFVVERKRFPEVEMIADVPPEKTFAQFDEKIKKSLEVNDYQEALETIGQALQAKLRRDQKIQLLKMKGSVHFLRQERTLAKETLEYIHQLDPEDQEVMKTLEMLQ